VNIPVEALTFRNADVFEICLVGKQEILAGS
jgi:hypothetical protein